LKFVNDAGREAVFDGDTLEPMIGLRYKGTFNYISPKKNPERWYDGLAWAKFAFYSFGRVIVDVAPYYAVEKNERDMDGCEK
jgi:hypothetical protein